MPRNFFSKSKIDLNTGYTPNFEVKLFGDWEKTIKILQSLDKNIKESGIKAQLKIGNEILKKVREHLRNQDLSWPQLSNKYKKQKQGAGLDERILIAYGTYYHAIKAWQKSNHHMIYIGIPKGIYTYEISGKKSKIDVAKIATINEFGQGKIPKRPLWNPTIKEMGGSNGLKEKFLISFIGHLRVRGIPIKSYMGLKL